METQRLWNVREWASLYKSSLLELKEALLKCYIGLIVAGQSCLYSKTEISVQLRVQNSSQVWIYTQTCC